MNWEETFRIISSVIISVGGAGAIFVALSSWIGKLWANKLMESYKSELEILRTTKLRYSGEQLDYIMICGNLFVN